MPTLYCHNEETIADILDKIRSTADESVTISIDPESVYWQNLENEAVLREAAHRLGKKISIMNESAAVSNVVDEVAPAVTVPMKNTTSQPNTEEANKTDEAADKSLAESKVKPKKSKSKSKFRKMFTFPFVLIPLLFIVLVLGGGAFAAGVYYLPQAEVELKVSKKSIQKESQVLLRSEQENVDLESLSIPVAIRSVEVDGTSQVDSTGIKTVGEKATGSITIYNWQDVAVQLPSGAIFTVNADQEGEGFTFISTAALTIAPRTVEVDGGNPVITPGTETIDVEASDVGALYNLPAGLKFTVNGYTYSYDGVQGVNAKLFSGGSTEEVTVVAQADIDTALVELQSGLEPKAKEELKKLLGDGEKLIEEHLVTEVTQESADAAADDEIEVFNVSSKIRANGYFYNEADLDKLLDELLKNSVPEGFTLSEDERRVSVAYVGVTEEGFIKIKVTVETLLIPDVDIENLKNELAGKKPEEAEKIVTNIEHVSEGQIVLRPKLPSFIRRLPFRTDRISVDITVE